MIEPTTLARPYARAAFEHARAAGDLAAWQAALSELAAITAELETVTRVTREAVQEQITLRSGARHHACADARRRHRRLLQSSSVTVTTDATVRDAAYDDDASKSEIADGAQSAIAESAASGALDNACAADDCANALRDAASEEEEGEKLFELDCLDVAARRQRLGLAGAELAACVAACSGVGDCISTPPSGPSSLTTGSIASVHSLSRCGTSRPTVG